MTQRVRLIWAEARGRVIGDDGGIPWSLAEDLRRFRRLTLGSAVIMGRKTWDALPSALRPLADRQNIVVTRDPEWRHPGTARAGSLDEAVRIAAGESGSHGDPWVIGGGQLLDAALPFAVRVERTEIDVTVPGTVVAPALDPRSWSATTLDPEQGWHVSQSGLRYRFRTLDHRTTTE